jgi:hypothetical protein
LSGVSQPALQRLLTGKVGAPALNSVAAVARTLGMGMIQLLDDGSIKFRATMSAKEVRTRQARVKATRLARLVEGASALEGQAAREGDFDAMVEIMSRELLAGSNRRLWCR